MTDNFKEIGSLFGREGAGVGFAKQTDKESFTYIQNEGGAPLPADALGTPEEQGIRAMLIATGEAPREVTLLPDKNGSTLKPLQALVGGNIETFDIAFGEGVSLYVNEEGLFTCPPNRAIFATEEMAKAGYLSQRDYSKVVEMGDFYTVLNGDIVAVGFDPETGESRSLTDGETARVEGYFTVISRPGSGAKAVDDIRHGITPGSYDISVESHDCTSGRNALAADAPARDAPSRMGAASPQMRKRTGGANDESRKRLRDYHDHLRVRELRGDAG